MAIGAVYEGDGFIRRGPAERAQPVRRADGQATVTADDGLESLETIEKRARALRRQYLNSWLCWLLER